MSDRPEYYILNADGDPWAVDLLTWAQWFEAHVDERRLAQETLPDGRHVSTVFLGFDHNLLGEGLPLLFETMVFDGDAAGECRRYSTRAEALEGHHQIVATLLGFSPAKE